MSTPPDIVVKISVPAAKALVVYGVQLAELNKQRHPEVSEGLDELAGNLWAALTQAGEIDKFNEWMVVELNKKL